MMMFREVKKSIVDLLGDNADGRFRVIGYKKQNKSAGAVVDNKRLVQVYYADGQFSKSAGRMRGPKSHDINLDIDITASAKAKGDISALLSDTATETQKALALSEIRTAAELADESVDETIDAVWNILMDARNTDAGLDRGEVSNRWIERIQKDTTVENGDLVVKTANLRYSCRVQEDPAGDIGNEPDTVIYDASIRTASAAAIETEAPVLPGAGVEVENEN